MRALSRSNWGVALFISVLSFAVQAPHVARDFAWVDSVELALAGRVFGIPHPTGYPLYLLFARIAAAMSGGNAAAGVNMLSAVFGAVACALVYCIGRAIGLGIAGALVAAATLLTGAELIRQSVVAEVYTLHLVIVLLLVWLAIRLGKEDGEEAGQERTVLLFVYLLGLGLAHHLTVVAALPGLVVLAGMFGSGRLRARWPSRRMGLLMAGLLLLPLTLYAVLAIRSRFDPLLDLGDPETLGRLMAHVSGRQFRYRLAGAEAGYVAEEVARFGSTIVREWPFFLLALALLGAIALAREPRRGRRLLAGLGLVGGLSAAHAIVYRIPDKEPYFLPLHAVLALLAGAGAGWLVALSGRWAVRRRLPLKPAIAQALMAAALVAMALSPGIPNLRAADHRADHSLRHFAEEVMRRTPPGSLIIADDTSLAFALLHLGTESGGAGIAGDRTVIAQYFLPLAWYQDEIAAVAPDLAPAASRLAGGRTGLGGRALGDRMAQDARALAAALARHAIGEGRPVFLTFHDFEAERRTFEGLPLVDLGLVYRVEAAGPEAVAAASGAVAAPGALRRRSRGPPSDAEFASLSAYTSGRRLTKEERSLAHRFASAANRSGIACVRAGDLARAEREFATALALDSLYAEAWLNRGLLRADYLGDPAGALADWRRYVTIAGDARDAGAVRTRIAALASTLDSLTAADSLGAGRAP